MLRSWDSIVAHNGASALENWIISIEMRWKVNLTITFSNFSVQEVSKRWIKEQQNSKNFSHWKNSKIDWKNGLFETQGNIFNR